jgi:polygalacturonase
MNRLLMTSFAVVCCGVGLSADLTAQPFSSIGTVRVTDFGARGDGTTADTKAIQTAIDACSEHGGGVVLVPAGTYLTGPLRLKSHVELRLSGGATILGSPHLSDYLNGQTPPPSRKSKLPIPPGSNPPNPLCVIGADDAEDIAITGPGSINGNGGSPEYDRGDNDPFRPFILVFRNCRDVRVSDVTLRDSGMWVQFYRRCRRVRINGVRVYSHANLNNDGLDIDSSDVNVSDCVIDSDDDGICLKSHDAEPCQNVTVSNCVVASNCNAIKFGTASTGGFRDITIQNCSIRPASEHRQRAWKDTISGLSLEMVDGGVMDGIAISNITMTGVQTPIFIRRGARAHPGHQALRNVIISNITARSDSPISNSITGIPDALVENVKLSHIILNCPGGGTAAMASRTVPENIRGYPENRMLGPSLPAFGFYVRHVRNLTLDDIQLHLLNPDERPALVFDDVQQLRLTGIDMDAPEADGAAITFDRARGVFVQGCGIGDGARTLVFSSEGSLDGIRLGKSDFASHREARP